MVPVATRAARHGAQPCAAVVLALVGTACGTPGAPDASSETIRNCDVDVAAEEPPERVFAAYQPAVEMAHALGISDRLVGTALLDAQVPGEYAEAQADQEYSADLPSREELLSHDPDFVLAGFNDVFTEENVGTRASLRELGIESWILSPLCPSEDGRTDDSIDPATVTMEHVYADLRDLGALFDVEERAEEVVTAMADEVDEVTETVADNVEEGDRPSVMIGRPASGGFRVAGGPDFGTEIVELAGGENAFSGLDDGRNHDVATEAVIDRDPDYILVDVCCDARMTAADAEPDVETIMADPALANLTAVTQGQVVEFTFADRSAGVRSAPAVATVARTIHPDLFD